MNIYILQGSGEMHLRCRSSGKCYHSFVANEKNENQLTFTKVMNECIELRVFDSQKAYCSVYYMPNRVITSLS